MLQENEGTISTQDQPTGSDIFVSVEMSRSKWVVGIHTPLADKIGLHTMGAQLGVTYKTAWLLTQKLRRSMIDPNRDLLEGVVEVDQQSNSVPGWRRVIRARQRGENSDCRSDRGHRARHHQAEAPAQGREVPRHALGRLRLAVIPDNSKR